ncbi:MAG: glycosyltransferase family 4 protein, partial [Armatimonadota bacterium]|nr:glycosyltransferase family 4 protein [Armatimonadota bacterium]
MPNESSRLPRVLFVATTKSEGGIERYALRLASSLRARGIFLIFACRPGSFLEAQCQSEGILTRPFRVRNSGDLGASWRLARIVRQERIDLVHVHSRRDYVPALLGVGLSRRARVVLHAHLI